MGVIHMHKSVCLVHVRGNYIEKGGAVFACMRNNSIASCYRFFISTAGSDLHFSIIVLITWCLGWVCTDHPLQCQQ